MMDFEYILNIKCDKKDIILGHEDNELLKVNILDYPSIIITGETGSGKSILLDQILVQLINKLTSMELGIIPIDTSGVELNYYADSKYTLFNAINDIDKSIVGLTRVLREIERRKNLLKEMGVSTVEEYNKLSTSILPFIVVAIDDDKFLLRNPDVEKMLTGIITQLSGLNMAFILATSDVHNKFFEKDNNTLASMLITFDYTNPREAEKANLDGADALKIGRFIAKYDDKVQEYYNFEFDDKIINRVLNGE